MPKNKRGMGIGDIYPVVLTIALVAILIAVVMFVLQEFGETMPLRTVTVGNASFNYVDNVTNSTPATSYASKCNFQNFVVTNAWNLSDGAPISSANYTTYPNSGILLGTPTMTSSLNGSHWNVSYTYQWGGEACEATESLIDDFVDFIPWIGVILLIIAAAIVLGILMKSFSGGSERI